MIKKILRQIVPPIFYYQKLKEIINYFLREKNQIYLEESFFKRHAFINKAISKYITCNYLEIGVGDNDVFNSIPLKLKNKYGVDPLHGGNYRLTSDDFFEKYKHLKFDVIFIDGLHHYLQCQKDAISAINSLNKNGVIFFHDMLPNNSFEEMVPRKQAAWTGDVWKVAVELTNSKNCDFRIINIDHGIGVLKINDNFEYKKMPELLNLRYKDFLNYYKKFKLVNSEETLDYLNSL
jgi:hypothetical protein